MNVRVRHFYDAAILADGDMTLTLENFGRQVLLPQTAAIAEAGEDQLANVMNALAADADIEWALNPDPDADKAATMLAIREQLTLKSARRAAGTSPSPRTSLRACSTCPASWRPTSAATPRRWIRRSSARCTVYGSSRPPPWTRAPRSPTTAPASRTARSPRRPARRGVGLCRGGRDRAPARARLRRGQAQRAEHRVHVHRRQRRARGRGGHHRPRAQGRYRRRVARTTPPPSSCLSGGGEGSRPPEGQDTPPVRAPLSDRLHGRRERAASCPEFYELADEPPASA